jgi:hypothetical protein
MTLIVYYSTMMTPSSDLLVTIASGMVAWALLAMPELIIGLWLVAKGTREARIGDVSGDLIPLVQKRVESVLQLLQESLEEIRRSLSMLQRSYLADDYLWYI